MKKILIVLGVAMLLLLAGCGSKQPVLYIFNWSDYIDSDLIKEFEAQNKCKVKYSTYDSNENMLTKVKSARESFDLIFPSGDHVSILNEAGLLEKLDTTKLKNYANLDPEILKIARSFDPENNLSIPYFWGLTGLMYNNQLVPAEIVASGSWNILADPFFAEKNKITMLDDAREVIGAALVYKGFNLNDTSAEALKAAHEVLTVWDANVTQYDSDSYKNEVPDGTTWLAQAYNGDALQQMAENKNLGFILPKEGTALWMDSIVMLKSSKNKDLAYKFIDFLLDAESAKRNAELTQYPTPNLAARKLIDATHTNNKLIYPDPEYLQKCFMIEYLGDKVKEIDTIYESIKLN